ncbi:MAG TPA: Hpt domain-containing protein, partial [Devosia sp.]|nr:Hpt domain-containing protein [Devosia sp.]
MSDLDDFKATYFDECSELLLDLEEQFAAIEAGDRSAERLNAVFRDIHSVKGGAGAFGFADLVAFAHAYETLLDHVRDGRIELSEPVTALCIRANDLVADFVAAAKAGTSLGAGYGADERKQFDALTSGGAAELSTLGHKGESGSFRDDSGSSPDEFDIDFTPVMVELPLAAEDTFVHVPLAVEKGHW